MSALSPSMARKSTPWSVRDKQSLLGEFLSHCKTVPGVHAQDSSSIVHGNILFICRIWTSRLICPNCSLKVCCAFCVSTKCLYFQRVCLISRLAKVHICAHARHSSACSFYQKRSVSFSEISFCCVPHSRASSSVFHFPISLRLNLSIGLMFVTYVHFAFGRDEPLIRQMQ